MRLWVRCFLVLLFLIQGTGVRAQSLPHVSQELETTEALEEVDSATLTVWNRPIMVFHASFEENTPKKRAEKAEERITELPQEVLLKPVSFAKAERHGHRAIMIFVGPYFVFAVLGGDVDVASGKDLEQTAQQAADQLSLVLKEHYEARYLPNFLRGLGVAVLATLFLILLLWAVGRIRKRIIQSIDTSPNHLPDWRAFGVQLRPHLVGVEKKLVGLGALVIVLPALYFWITFVFAQFYYTKPWSDLLGAYLWKSAYSLFSRFIEELPNLGTVALVFFLAHLFTRLVRGIFAMVEHRTLALPGLQPETARVTRRLVLILVWLFALVVAYPYMPGSGTDAFKGVSVFLGLVVSLGSTGLVNQIMSGLVIIYSRSLSVGEYVRVGEHEGVVTELGMLATKIKTRRKEEISIPNGVLVSTTTINYSRLAGYEGSILHAAVTIGYDAPWRQVHAMLVLAAQRTAGVKSSPEPRVLQKALGDFGVEYHVLVHIADPVERIPILSELHAHIQDAFNEYGVQIMTPAFESQPEGKVMVSQDHWYDAPAQQSHETGS